MPDLFLMDIKQARTICGVDEAGRGPLAGDVYAAAVILDPDQPIIGLDDSKKLTAKRREALFVEIQAKAMAWHIAYASVAEIDTLNILQACMLAMSRAVQGLNIKPDWVWIDGNHFPKELVRGGYTGQALVQGDALQACISAASILAKVARDATLLKLHDEFPQYGFAQHKGYPTAQHIAALKLHGVTPHHRTSFAPVRMIIESGV